VRADEEWDLPDFDHFDWTKYESEKQQKRESCDKAAVEEDEEADDQEDYDDDEDYDDYDDYDQGQPEIEGSRRVSVGWMKIYAGSLVPAYSTLFRSQLWDHFYRRPPQVVDP
jgi:hypothetical protein